MIDNRSWHPRGVDSTLMTEIFVEDDCFLNCTDEEANCKTIDDRIEEVNAAMTAAIRQPDAKVKVTRWYPGVLQAIVEEVKSKSSTQSKLTSNRVSVKDMLAKEATKTLESKRNIQIAATKEKSLDEIKKEMGIPIEHAQAAQAEPSAPAPVVTDLSSGAVPPPTTTRRRVRQKMRSTPVTGGSLFDGPKQAPAPEEPKVHGGAGGREGSRRDPFMGMGGQSAELVVGGEVFKIRVMPETVHRIRSGYSGELLEDSSVKFSGKDVPIEHRLQGIIRTSGLQTISEVESETVSEVGSDKNSERDSEW